MNEIPFNRPNLVGREFDYMRQAIDNGHISGNGPFTRRCEEWLQQELGAARVMLTPSCTAALELAAMLAGVGEGDEVIMPSFTFSSTANAFVLRGAKPVFVDIRPDTLNLDPDAVAVAIGERTRAIVPVHYAGVACELDSLAGLAENHELLLIEDSAQALGSSYRGRPLGVDRDIGALSFHETKNVLSGEGGALLLRDEALVEQAEILQEKGTNRRQFFRGQTDKYTWVDAGSSFLMGDITAAFLLAQLEQADATTARRVAIWQRYHDAFAGHEREGRVRRPIVPDDVVHNGHLYYLLLPTEDDRDAFIQSLGERGVMAVFHYVPLHSSPAGRRFGRTDQELAVTDDASSRLVRLPLWPAMTDEEIGRVIDAVDTTLVGS